MYHHNKGFMILEILLAMGLLVLICIPIFQISVYLKSNTMHSNIFTKMHEIQGKSVTGVLRRSADLGGIKICTSFLKNPGVLKKIEVGLQFGTTTVISSMKMLGGDIYMSLNSASTSDHDIAVFDPISKTIQASLHTGPGTSDMTFVGSSIYLTNTGVSSDVQHVTYQNSSLSLQNSCVLKTVRNDQRVPRVITAALNMLIVGFEKNDGPEIFVIDTSCRILQRIETGYGIYDMYSIDDLVYVLGPSDPEIEVYKFEDGMLNKIYTYDAPGFSGNGRSLDIYKEGVIFGRSRGNDELAYLSEEDNSLISKMSAKVGSSIDIIISGEEKHIVGTSNSNQELQIFDTDLKKVTGMDLSGRVTSALCVGDELFLGINSTTTPLTILSHE
ncbi:MAG: hypothetical protein FGM57_00215 [Candidatus Taylorbacteria bacterium]|nr:hypothetical protein [Candidatus Taylorbacteria bacterium]